jgi:urease accessory protein
MRFGSAQLRLLTWFSPAFPIGAFGYSHGLETAIREGRVTDAKALQAWIAGLVAHGSAWSDAVLFKLAWAAADEAELADLTELATALCVGQERRRETLAQGEAFAAAVRAWASGPAAGPYPVVAGAACATAALPLEASLTAWLHGFAANLVSVALRAVPLGQTDGVAVLAALEPILLATAERAASATLDDLGSAAIVSDIAALRHETLQPRLFIS